MPFIAEMLAIHFAPYFRAVFLGPGTAVAIGDLGLVRLAALAGATSCVAVCESGSVEPPELDAVEIGSYSELALNSNSSAPVATLWVLVQ